MIATGNITTKRELARATGWSQKHVDDLTSRHDFPGGRGGPWDFQAVMEWHANGPGRKRAVIDGDEDDDGLQIQRLKAEIKKLKADAEGKELRNEEKKGQLLPAEVVDQWIGSRFLRVKSRIEQFPAELQVLAPQELRPQFREAADALVNELLLEMSGWEFEE